MTKTTWTSSSDTVLMPQWRESEPHQPAQNSNHYRCMKHKTGTLYQFCCSNSESILYSQVLDPMAQNQTLQRWPECLKQRGVVSFSVTQAMKCAPGPVFFWAFQPHHNLTPTTTSPPQTKSTSKQNKVLEGPTPIHINARHTRVNAAQVGTTNRIQVNTDTMWLMRGGR